MIRSVAVREFRGITTPLTFNLGRVTLLSGRNGLGKTTFFDAIDWCLFGAAWRLGHVEDATRSLYSDGTPSVTVEVDFDDEEVVIERASDGVTVNGEEVSDRELAERFLVDPDLFPPYTRDLGARIRRLLYLPQSEILEIVGSSSAPERAALFAALEGVPNAAVVMSAIRRLRERLEERSANVSDRLATVRLEVQALQEQTKAAAFIQTEEEGTLLAATSGALGVGAVTSLAEAWRATGDRRKLVVEQLTTQKAAERAIPALLAERDEVAQTLAKKKHELVQLSSQQEELTRKATRVAETLQATQERAASEEQALVGLETRLSAAQRNLSRAQELAAQREQLVGATKEAEDATAGLAKAAHRVEQAQRKRSELRDRMLRYRKRLDYLRSRRELHAKVDELEKARKRIGDVADAERRQRVALEAIAARLQAARVAYDERLGRASALERLQGQLIDVARSAQDLRLTHCPLCGQHYESAEALVGHMRDAFGELSAPGKQSVDRSDLHTLQAQHDELGREVAELGRQTVKFVETEKRLLQEVEPLSKAVGGEEEESRGADMEELEAALRSIEAEVTVSDEELGGFTSARDRESGAARRAEDALASLKDVIAGLAAQLDVKVAPDREESVAQLLAEIETVRGRTGTVRSQLDSLQLERQQLLTDLSTLQMRATGVRAEVAAREGQLRNSELRLAQMGGARDGWAEELRSKLAATERGLSALEALEERLGRALVSQERTRSVALQEKLGVEGRELGSSVASIATALKRLGVFEAAAHQAVREASAGARGHLANIVQECVAALYPHRHLDHVVLREGAVLLTDEMLADAVDPEAYASSGQLNVLALAVFLGCAARQRLSRLPLILLDEPVQSLDDIHFLALVGLLKRLASTHQVIVSAADRNVAEVCARQFRSSTSVMRSFVHHEWVDFDPKEGPMVVHRPGPAVSQQRPA